MNASTNATAAAMAGVTTKGGAIPRMWVPCVIFAHLFAATFLLGLLRVQYPGTWERLIRALLCRGKPKQGTHENGPGPQHAAAAGAGYTHGSKAGAAAAGTGQDVKSVDQNTAAAVTRQRSPAGAAGAVGLAQAGRATTFYYDCEAGGAEPAGEGGSVSSHGSADLISKLTSQVRPMLLEWEELGCSYNTGKEVKAVLQGVWGRADPGDLVALMGPSGAGKSTLMDILAGRKSLGHLTGQVLVNKQRRRKEQFRKVTAYVPQDDNFLPTMTVHETMQFYATLQLPNKTGKADRESRIVEVLAAMGLSHTTDTLVGGALPGGLHLRGLSGGERKRLSIAQGIMSTPCVVFLDEPTSGLDSFAALSVMSYMRGMATAGSQTVVSSIHQPRAAIWALFDKVVLLSSGRMMYSGVREGLVPWFVEGCGYPYDPAMHGLASDWVMDLVNIGFTKPVSLFGKMMNTETELHQAADTFLEKYLVDNSVYDTKQQQRQAAAATASALPVSSRGGAQQRADASPSSSRDQEGDVESGGSAFMGAGAGAMVVSGGGGGSAHGGSQHGSSPSRKSWFGGRQEEAVDDGLEVQESAGWFKQCRVLLWRELKSVTRNPADVAGRCLIFTWLAIFLGLIFYNLPPTVDALRARMNVLFVEPVILLLLPYVYMSLFTSDKQYFIQDVSGKLYRTSAYYVAKQLAVLPFAVINSLLFAYTLYGMAGLRNQPRAVGMNGIMSVLIYLIAAQVLTLAAVVMPNQDLAFMAAIGWTAINLLMSNFMVRYKDFNQQWFSQLRYLSAMGFAFDGYAQAEFSGVTYSCSGGLAPSITGFLPQFLPNTPVIRSETAVRQISTPGAGCVVELDSILNYFDLHRKFGVTVAILFVYLAVLHLATFLGQLHLTKQEKR